MALRSGRGGGSGKADGFAIPRWLRGDGAHRLLVPHEPLGVEFGFADDFHEGIFCGFDGVIDIGIGMGCREEGGLEL